MWAESMNHCPASDEQWYAQYELEIEATEGPFCLMVAINEQGLQTWMVLIIAEVELGFVPTRREATVWYPLNGWWRLQTTIAVAR